MVTSTFLNMMHFLFYFLTKDGIINVDGCSMIRTFFIIIAIDFLFMTLNKILIYLFNFYEVFLFFIINWMFLAAVVEVLFVAFSTYYDHEEFYTYNFTDYFKSLFSVFIFFTGNNSPEMIIKNYPKNKLITRFFMTFVWINNVILMGLLIGLSYYKMK